MDKELDSLIGMELKSQMLDSRDDVLRTNKLKKITKVAISLNELNNSDNLEDGRPSNTLYTYYVTSLEYYTCFEPCNPRYMKLKYGEIVSLMLKITDQNNNIIKYWTWNNCSASYSIIKMYITISPISTGGRCFSHKFCLPVDNFFSFESIATKFGDFSQLGISKIFNLKNQK